MKKILFTSIFLFTIFFSNIVFWDCNSGCMIQNWPPDVLNNYLRDLKKVINNYNTELVKNPPKTWLEKEYSKTKTEIIRSFNKITSWDNYFTNFDFYVMYGTKNEYVPEIWRDYNLLKQEWIYLEKYYKKALSRWYADIVLDSEKICAWIKNCDLSGSALDILWEIYKNHDNIKNYFKLSIIWKRNLFWWNLILVWKNFKDELYKYYNENTTRNCSTCEWWVFDRITKQIDKISNWQEATKTWMKSWQDAIAMLDGSLSDREYERIERDLLKKELWQSASPINASETVLKNLDKYNQWWFSLDNNFITNSFDSVKNSITSQIDSFKDSILQKFKNKKEDIPTVEFAKSNLWLQDTSKIEELIAEMYNKELPYAQLIDNSKEKLEWRIIELHYNLTQIIKTFDSSIKTSQKVCNDQWQWLWKCD